MELTESFVLKTDVWFWNWMALLLLFPENELRDSVNLVEVLGLISIMNNYLIDGTKGEKNVLFISWIAVILICWIE